MVNLFVQCGDVPASPHWIQPTDCHLLQSAKGLEEVARSNLVLWIDISFIAEMAFIPHSEDVVSQKYGPLAGCSHTFYSCRKIIFKSSNLNDFPSRPVSCEKYQVFGAKCSTLSPVPYSQCIVEMIHSQLIFNHKLLTQGANFATI